MGVKVGSLFFILVNSQSIVPFFNEFLSFHKLGERNCMICIGFTHSTRSYEKYDSISISLGIPNLLEKSNGINLLNAVKTTNVK